MDLATKVDFLCEAIIRLENKLDEIIEKKNLIPRPTSSEQPTLGNRQKEVWLKERLTEMEKNR